MDIRIVIHNNRYYSQYYKETYFFGLLGGYWETYKEEQVKEIFNKDNWELNNNL
jgi:hypothetical protein